MGFRVLGFCGSGVCVLPWYPNEQETRAEQEFLNDHVFVEQGPSRKAQLGSNQSISNCLLGPKTPTSHGSGHCTNLKTMCLEATYLIVACFAAR